MSSKFIKKNMELSLELDKYLARHPKALENIPRGACLVITKKGDSAFSRASIEAAEKAKEEKQKCIEARKEGGIWIFQPLSA